MALSILKELLQGYEKSLFDEGLNILSNLGIINDQFSRIQALKSADNPDRVIQLINAYSVEVEAILSELRSCIDLPDIDFSKLAAQAHNIEEKSMCVGAEHVRRACTDLIQACEQKHKGKSQYTLGNQISEVASHLRNQLHGTEDHQT